MKNNRTMLERLAAMAMCLVLLVGLVPAGAMPIYAAETDTANLGTVTAVTEGLEVFNPDPNNEQLVNNADEQIVLEWCEADPEIGRNVDGWWVGVKITAPEGYSEDATFNYHRYNGTTSTGLSFKEHIDLDATDASMTMFSLVDEELIEKANAMENEEDRKIVYALELDWDADGAIDQTVNLELYPENIALMDQGSTWVEGVTDGLTVTYGQEAIEVTNEETITLNFEEQDDTIGRYSDGWWVGVKITAPEVADLDAAIFDCERYQGRTSYDVSFAENADVEGGNYITMWALVTEDMLAEGNTITYQWSMNWDGENTADAIVKLTLDPSKIILCDADGDKLYADLTSSFGGILTGANTNNTVLTVKDKKVVWRGADASDNNRPEGWTIDAKVTAPNGEETVYWLELKPDNGSYTEISGKLEGTFNWNGSEQYMAIVAEKVTLVKAEQAKPQFETPGSVNMPDSFFSNGYTNAVTNTDKADGQLTYTISPDDLLKIDANGTITVRDGKWKDLGGILWSGENYSITVTATFAETDTHNQAQNTYTFNVSANQDKNLEFTDTNVTVYYGEQDAAQGESGNTYQQKPTTWNEKNIEGIEYVSSDTTVATVDENGKVTFLKVGEVSITATATYKKDYTPTSVSYTLKIEKGQQDELKFAESMPQDITYDPDNTTFANAATGGTTGETVVYEIVEEKPEGHDEAVAQVAADGTLTILAAGTVTVRATMPGNDFYEDQTAEYSLTIQKAEQHISFKNGVTADEVANNIGTHPIEMADFADNYHSDEAFVFTDASEDMTITHVDQATGIVTVSTEETGELTVTVTRPGDARFLEWTGEYTLTVVGTHDNTADMPFVLAGTAGENGWYTSNVTVTLEGYKLLQYTENDKGDHKKKHNWKNAVEAYELSVEGVTDLYLCIKGEDGTGCHMSVGEIKIDKTAPVSKITYADDVFGNVLEVLSFGYYNAPTTVTISAVDNASGVAQICYSLDGTNFVTLTPNKEGKVSFLIEDEYEGKVQFYAVDNAGLKEDTKTSNTTIVVDTLNPKLDVTYSYAAAEGANDLCNEVGDTIYTKYAATVTFVINEANFDLADKPIFKVNGNEVFVGSWLDQTASHTLNYDGAFALGLTFKDKSGNAMEPYAQKFQVDTKVPVINVQMSESKQDADGVKYYSDEMVAKIIVEDASFNPGGVSVEDNGAEQQLSADKWTEVETGKWVYDLPLSAEGQHILTVDCTDYAYNTAATYTAETVIIDYTDPEIQLTPDYDENRSYTNNDAGITVTVKVTETNFRASDVNLEVVAEQAQGKVMDYAAYAKDATKWQTGENADEHVLKLTFDVDANYTLKVNYADLAKRDAEENSSQFTLDRVAPDGLNVTFQGTAVNDGFYGKTIDVVLSADDAVSGIARYEYDAGPGSFDGTTNSSFSIDPQFKGTVTFVAYDKAGNSTELADTEQVVVDSIAPTCNVTYNAPYQTVGNTAYYAEDIKGTITITEANFFSADVKVAVTKDGVAQAVNVAWNGNIGSFTLNGDGSYVVSITYTDRSGNAMAAYTSNPMILDTEAPAVKAINIVANSANKDENYAFEVEISDINLDPDTMAPVLTAVLKDDKGNYTTQELQMTAPDVVEPDQTYRFAVENLTEDALYTLTCTVKDLAGNEMTQLLLDDEKLYDEVQFSINRSGSAFGYGDEYSENLMNQYYVQNVDKDVVLVEVNVDPIENYVVTLNGKELVEGQDFTSVQTSEDGEWSKRQYIIHKELFASEGEYSIVIHSTDKAETPAYSDVKNLATAFVVDQTAPVLTITGLETGGRYLTQEQTVTLIPTDEGGRLNSLKVVVLDSDGQPLIDENGTDISLRFEMSGEELLTYLDENEGMITFTVPEGLNNQVQIICNDCAVDSLGQTNEYNEIFERVTVSQNQFIIFFANKPLFYGVIAGILGLLILIILLFKRKKKEDEK